MNHNPAIQNHLCHGILISAGTCCLLHLRSKQCYTNNTKWTLSLYLLEIAEFLCKFAHWYQNSTCLHKIFRIPTHQPHTTQEKDSDLQTGLPSSAAAENGSTTAYSICRFAPPKTAGRRISSKFSELNLNIAHYKNRRRTAKSDTAFRFSPAPQQQALLQPLPRNYFQRIKFVKGRFFVSGGSIVPFAA